MTTLIGQPQYETSQPIYQNNNMPSKPTAAKILGKVGESLSRICCVRPPVERFTFVGKGAAPLFFYPSSLFHAADTPSTCCGLKHL